MRLVGTIGGNLTEMLAADANAVADALRRGIEAASRSLQEELRGQVRAAGLGAGLEKAWQREVYPRPGRRTLRPAALVYSKATVLHEAFDAGGTILPKRGGFLVVPTEAGRRLGLGKVDSARKGGAVPGGRARSYADLQPWADRMGATVESTSTAGRARPGGARRGKRAGGARVVLLPMKSRGGLVAVYIAAPGAAPVIVARLLPRVPLRKFLDIDGAASRADAVLAAALGSV